MSAFCLQVDRVTEKSERFQVLVNFRSPGTAETPPPFLFFESNYLHLSVYGIATACSVFYLVRPTFISFYAVFAFFCGSLAIKSVELGLIQEGKKSTELWEVVTCMQ